MVLSGLDYRSAKLTTNLVWEGDVNNKPDEVDPDSRYAPAAHASEHEPAGGDVMAVDAVVGTGSLRTLGGGAQQAMPGNAAPAPGAHKDTHDPQTGGDPLDCAAPGTIDENANAEGNADTLARSNHNHQHTAALHENGGGAEVNIAGLSGESAELNTHKINTTTAHGAVSEATASKFVIRDASGRAKFAAPGIAGQALIRGTRVTTAELPAMTDNCIWKGTGGSVGEVTVAASRILGRKAAGDIDDLTPAEILILLTGQSTTDFSMNTHKITSVTDPGDNQDAATKKYVDDSIPDPPPIYSPCTYATAGMTVIGSTLGGNATNEETVAAAFYIPQVFASLVSAVAVIVAQDTNAVADIDTYSNYAANGETRGTHSESEIAATYDITNNVQFEIDISGILSSLAAGDYGTILLIPRDVNSEFIFLGIRINYT